MAGAMAEAGRRLVLAGSVVTDAPGKCQTGQERDEKNQGIEPSPSSHYFHCE